MTIRHIATKVAGASQRNADGSARQTLIAKVRQGERLVLVPEPDNPYDANALKICRSTGEQLGYLNRDLAAEVAPKSQGDKRYVPYAIEVTGGGERHYGLNLMLVVADTQDSDEMIAGYVQGVLEGERRHQRREEREMRTVRVGLDLPQPPRPAVERNEGRPRVGFIVVGLVVLVLIAIALLTGCTASQMFVPLAQPDRALSVKGADYLVAGCVAAEVQQPGKVEPGMTALRDAVIADWALLNRRTYQRAGVTGSVSGDLHSMPVADLTFAQEGPDVVIDARIGRWSHDPPEPALTALVDADVWPAVERCAASYTGRQP
jgi:hypothetical protein